MKIPVMQVGLVGAVILLTTAMATTLPGDKDAPAAALVKAMPRATAAQAAVSIATPAHTPRTTVLFNDPVRQPHAISDAIAANVAATAPGESIDVSTYLIDSPRIATELLAADRRGVVVRVILAGGEPRRTSTSRALARGLNADRDSSQLIWSDTSARGRDGMMHEKTFRFSRVGGATWVTMTGSYNASDVADRASYATMWQVVDRPDIYSRFAAVARDQRAQRTLRQPFRAYEGAGWSAYFLPNGQTSPQRDPVLARLARIPAHPSSVIRIAMFSMWDLRGQVIAERLADLARGGAQVTFVAGPTVSREVLDTITAGGVSVHSGCFADGRYAHGKDMTASYLVDGRRELWTWIGSDNWTTRGLHSDQAVLGLRTVGYRIFARAFARLTARDDGVFGDDCVPRP